MADRAWKIGRCWFRRLLLRWCRSRRPWWPEGRFPPSIGVVKVRNITSIQGINREVCLSAVGCDAFLGEAGDCSDRTADKIGCLQCLHSGRIVSSNGFGLAWAVLQSHQLTGDKELSGSFKRIDFASWSYNLETGFLVNTFKPSAPTLFSETKQDGPQRNGSR